MACLHGQRSPASLPVALLLSADRHCAHGGVGKLSHVSPFPRAPYPSPGDRPSGDGDPGAGRTLYRARAGERLACRAVFQTLGGAAPELAPGLCQGRAPSSGCTGAGSRGQGSRSQEPLPRGAGCGIPRVKAPSPPSGLCCTIQLPFRNPTAHGKLLKNSRRQQLTVNPPAPGLAPVLRRIPEEQGCARLASRPAEPGCREEASATTLLSCESRVSAPRSLGFSPQ